MKTRLTPQGGSPAGHALLMVLCLTAASMVVLAATIGRTSGNATLNARNRQYYGGLYAAEAATEKVYAMMQSDFLTGNLTAITNGLPDYRAAIPTASEDPYWGRYQFSDGAGHLNSNSVQCISEIKWGALRSQYAGLYGWTNAYRVVSNVKLKPAYTPYDITSTCQQEIEMDLVPVFQFAIFYNNLLEFTWCATMIVNGRTHCNGDIYVGSISPLTFNDLVTSHGSLTKPNWFGHVTSDYSAAVNYTPKYSTNCPTLNLPIGTTNVHAIIEMPPPGGDTNQALALQRYFNKADMVLLVSNNTVSVTLKTSSSDPGTNITAYYYPTNSSPTNYVQITNNFPFLYVTNFYGTGGVSTNYFMDQRENDQVKSTDINMGSLKSWLVSSAFVKSKFPNTAGVYAITNVPNILYVADNRTYNTNSQLTAVRLRNAQTIPTNLVTIAGNTQPSGFTVATPNPLYVQGHYNCPVTADLGKNTTPSAYPASLVSDALTILSTLWNDARSNDSFSTGVRVASSTTVNAAIVTGVVASTGSSATTFSGGVQNLPRLLEDWGNGSASVVLTLNTSIVNFFNSTMATHQFEAPGGYYYAPTRQFSFDLNFLDYSKQPPGTPMLGYVLRANWAVPPPNTVSYTEN